MRVISCLASSYYSRRKIGLLWIAKYIYQPFFKYYRHPKNSEMAEDILVQTAEFQLTCLFYAMYFWYCDFKFLLENTFEAHRSLYPNKLQPVTPKENLVKMAEVPIFRAINLLTSVLTASVHILLYGYLFWGSPQGQSSEVTNISIMFPSNYLKIQITVMQNIINFICKIYVWGMDVQKYIEIICWFKINYILYYII